jgi:hypothetical protein
MRFLFVLVVVLACGVAVGQARADDVSTYGTGNYVVGQSSADPIQPLASGCNTVTAWRGFKLLIGPFAWKYFARIHWCWAKKKITVFDYARWGEVYVPTWDFKGHIGKEGYGGVGTWYARRWTQGKFQQCAQFCIQTKTPWVELKVFGDGGAKWASGG